MLKSNERFSIKDVFNVRPLVLAAFSQIAGVVAMKNEAYIFAAVFVFILVIISVCFMKKGSEMRLLFLLAAAFFAIGFITALIENAKYMYGYDEIEGVFSGHVARIEYNGYAYIKNVFIDDEYLGNFVIKTSDSLYVGQDIYFYGEAEKREIFGYYGISSKLVQFSAKYEIYSADIIYAYDYSPTLDEKIRLFYQSELFENMSYDSAALSLAMMFGDTSYLNSDTLNIMRISGIAHIFAVSGLHVGVLYSIFNKIVKKNRRYIRLVAIPMLLFGYAYICGNSPSSLRAATMFSVMNIANCLFMPTDKLNSIAIAAIVVMLLSPFSVYSEGCLLSFAVVLSLTIFGNFFVDLLKIESDNEFLSTVNTSLVANIGSLPLISCFFGHISLISLPLNVIVIPTASFIYTITFLLLPIGGAFGVNLLRFSDIGLYLLESLCELFTDFGSVIYITMSEFSVVIYYLIMLFMSEYCFLQRKKKALIVLPLFAILVISVLA